MSYEISIEYVNRPTRRLTKKWATLVATKRQAEAKSRSRNVVTVAIFLGSKMVDVFDGYKWASDYQEEWTEQST